MRAFIAIELPEDLRIRLAAVKDRLETGGDKIRWVKPENMHLTLKFLGEISEKQAENIGSALNKLAEEYPLTTLEIGGVGVFPRRKNPKVIWAGIKENQVIKKLHESIENIVFEEGIEKDKRPFKPHLTIGRVKQMEKTSRLPDLLDEVELETVNVPVKHITLFRSKLTPEGPIYTRLTKAELQQELM
ncbi:MAG: RNA 2',3'-cyclic phosphodiesterase [Candidatus Electryonea clarkiae]|nr:RNA 2',3'-cyclic phosphodiesterase [Candidatus Electryonea clarkiae]MDP8288047.1 RNA 2',3'-cyclic phosphodiesterase [Candidatus Electryonea clarkiae]